MNTQNWPGRRAAYVVARAGVIGSIMMLTATAWSVMIPAGAATNAGNAVVSDPNSGQPLTAGQKSTAFTLDLPDGSACTGDSPNDGYRWQTYMVPDSVDPATLQFGSAGPMPPGTGASFRQPLYTTTGDPVVNQQTAAASPAPGPGPIVNVPAFDFDVYADPGIVPAGTYNLGVACTLGPPDADQLDKYWNARMTLTADAAAWTAAAQDPPASTTTTTAAPGSTTTSTTVGSTTTTTTAGTASTTTTTTAGADLTTTTTPSLFAAASGGSSGGGGGGTVEVAGTSTGAIARTGPARAARLVFWAALAAGFGYLLHLAAMPPRVRSR